MPLTGVSILPAHLTEKLSAFTEACGLAWPQLKLTVSSTLVKAGASVKVLLLKYCPYKPSPVAETPPGLPTTVDTLFALKDITLFTAIPFPVCSSPELSLAVNTSKLPGAPLA